MPAVAQVVEQGWEFTQPVTFVVGDNGSGKSTLVEAVAEGFGLDARGGRAARKSAGPDASRTELGQVLQLETTAAGRACCPGCGCGRKGSSCAPRPRSG